MRFFFLVWLSFFTFVPSVLRAASGVTASASSLNFGNQAEGTFSDPLTVTLTNSGGGDGVIWTLTLAGESPLQFLIWEDGCSATVLAPGASCGVSLVYAPSADFPGPVGAAQALLQVPFNDPPSLSIALSGNEIVPEISSSVSDFNFGSQVAGQLSDPESFTLTNNGAADLILKNTKIIGANSTDFAFSTDLCSFQVLSPGESCDFDLSMRPTALGERNGQVAVESNDPDTPVLYIDLQGNGTGSGGCGLQSSNVVQHRLTTFLAILPLMGLFLGRWYQVRHHR